MLAALEKEAEAFNEASHALTAQSWDPGARVLPREGGPAEGEPAASVGSGYGRDCAR